MNIPLEVRIDAKKWDVEASERQFEKDIDGIIHGLGRLIEEVQRARTSSEDAITIATRIQHEVLWKLPNLNLETLARDAASLERRRAELFQLQLEVAKK